MANNKSNYQVGFVFNAKKASSFNKAFDSVGKSIGSVTKGIAAAGTAFLSIGAIKGAIDTFSDFQASMSNVKALTGATGEEFKALENAALEMGKKTSKTAKESADALGYMALAGWDSATAIKGLEPILRLSEAGALDLARTSDLVTDSMSALGIQVENLPIFLDQVAQTSRKANTDVGMLMEAFIGVGGTLNGLNVPLDEANTALGVLANRGIKGSEAGNKLNTLLINITTGAGQAGKAMAELGVKAFDSEGKFKGLENVLGELNDKTKVLSDEQRNSYYAMIGGKTQVDTLNALMSGFNTTTSEGISEFVSLRNMVIDSNGTLMDMANTMNDNLSGAFKRLESAVDDFKISMVKGVEPYLTPFIDKLAVGVPRATESFTKAFSSVKAALTGDTTGVDFFTQMFGGDAAKGQEAFDVISNIGKEIKFAYEKAKEFGGFIADNWPTILPILVNMGKAFVAWKIGKVAVDIGKTGLALVQLPKKIYSNVTALGALKLAKAKDKAETIALNAMYAKEKVMLVANKAATLAHSAAQTTAAGVTKGVAAAQGLLNAAFVASPIGWIVLGIGALIAVGVLLYKNWDTVKAKAFELWEGMKTAFTPIGEFFSGIWDGVTGTFKGFINGIIDGVNFATKAINKLSFTVPDWVPGIGGQTVGFDIKQIPHFAKGGIVQKATTAVVGEAGPEAVLPLKGNKAASILQKALQPKYALAGMDGGLQWGSLIQSLVKTRSGSAQHYHFSPVVYAEGKDKSDIKELLNSQFRLFKAELERDRKSRERDERRRNYE